jgi:hypothetical protein
LEPAPRAIVWIAMLVWMGLRLHRKRPPLWPHTLPLHWPFLPRGGGSGGSLRRRYRITWRSALVVAGNCYRCRQCVHLVEYRARPGTLFEAKLTAVGFHETPPARHDRCDRSASRRGSHRERGVAAKLGQGWLVGLVQTVFVMGQHVDDPAFGDAALRACLEHLLYLGLERIQPLDPACDALQVLARQRIRFRA